MAKSTPIEPKSKADFDKAISVFAEKVKVEVSIITNEQMRLLLRDAMIFTPPMLKGGGQGLSPKALTAGMGKLSKDVKRIFVPMDQGVRSKGVFLRQVINAVQGTGPTGRSWMDFIALQPTEKNIKGLSPVMRKIMQDSDTRRAYAKAQNYLSKARADGSIRPILGPTNDLKDIHDKYKTKVGGRWKKNAPVGGPQYMVGTALFLQAYIAERQLKVGYTKAGWATALRMIPPLISSKGNARNYGAYDAPWVDRNRSPMGQFTMSQTATGTSMTATNLIGNINNVATDANTVNIVYGNRVKQIYATVDSRTKDHAERANRK
ncbi:MAG: hypothetical protein B9S28_06455 [Opitutia bacterium Tous-C10FEB]|nr:MAG: hypothetical protein B9S28_06455 [Opitutae bacterium Tous-C10FEB]